VDVTTEYEVSGKIMINTTKWSNKKRIWTNAPGLDIWSSTQWQHNLIKIDYLITVKSQFSEYLLQSHVNGVHFPVFGEFWFC
jgi:hypothetical protein